VEECHVREDGRLEDVCQTCAADEVDQHLASVLIEGAQLVAQITQAIGEGIPGARNDARRLEEGFREEHARLARGDGCCPVCLPTLLGLADMLRKAQDDS
jgi:hypothetical protein